MMGRPFFVWIFLSLSSFPIFRCPQILRRVSRISLSLLSSTGFRASMALLGSCCMRMILCIVPIVS